jgi:hypothetical protein
MFQVISTSPPAGQIIKQGMPVTLSCASNVNWFFCVWRSPGGGKQCAIQETTTQVSDFMIFKNIFAEKFSGNIGVFCSNYILLVFLKKNVIVTLVFEKNANFFAENWQKSQKFVIITLTPVFNGKQIYQFVGAEIYRFSLRTIRRKL